LLKILSRVIHPTTGEAILRGRVASLLEVGTGFHPELTGRENIFMSGAVLGMQQDEIKRNFDAIAEFAEVEKFLDVPVKRYSSGMYVRLAFAVAAHLDTEILIIDEVLAVGDARFQDKCLGRMQAIGKEGRTILYVSHSMSTVSSLCDRVILINYGKIVKQGSTSEVVLSYYAENNQIPTLSARQNSIKQIGDCYAILVTGAVRNTDGNFLSEIEINQPIQIEMIYDILDKSNIEFVPNFHLHTVAGVCVLVTSTPIAFGHTPGQYKATCSIPPNFLNEGVYTIGLALSSFTLGAKIHFYEKHALTFNIKDSMHGTVGRIGWAGEIPGIIRPEFKWEVTNIQDE
jgi:lipopolysaccharide transport system ATP-binding protein